MRAGVTPNALTVAGLVGSAAAAVLVLTRSWFWAGVVFVIASVMDMLDGSVARLSGRASPFGAFLDSTLDRLAEALVLGAIGVTLAADGHEWAVAVTFLALAGSFLVSYTRARAEGLGIETNRGGLMSRPERLVLIGAAIFLAPIGPVRQVAMTILCFLTLLTVAQRLLHVHHVLKRQGVPTTTHRGGDPTP